MKKIYILFFIITSYACTAQILLNGRLIHELPAKSSVDTGDLIIVANPSTGKPYKARKNQVIAGANGVTDGDKGDITVTGSGGVFTIDGSSVQNGKLAMMGDNTFKGNLAGTTASPQDLTSGQMISALGINLKMNLTDTASLSNRINAKQNTLVSGSNIKSINGNSLVGSGDVTITSAVAWGNITGSNIMLQTDLRDSFEHTIAAGTTGQYWRGDKTWQTLNKAAVGLSAVDNTADVDKPISNATNAALAGKQAQLVSGTNIKTINFIDLLGSGNITISGGSGGGETLDQTLALGNVTDTNIVFSGIAPIALISGNIHSSNFLISQFRADTMFGFGMGYSKHVNVNPSFTGTSNADNYVWMIGTNVSDGNANRLDTAKGQWLLSFEHNYETVTGSLFNEFHIISTPPGSGGSGVRMMSLNPRHDNKFTDNYISGGLRIAPMYNASLTGINFIIQNDPANSNKSSGLELYSLNDTSSAYLNLRGYTENIIRFQRPVGSTGAGTLDDLLKYQTMNSKATFLNAAPVARYGYGQLVLGGIGNTNLSISVDISSHPGVLHLGSVAHYTDQPYHNPNVVQINYNNTGFNELNTGIDVGGAFRLNNYSAGGHKWTFGANATNFFINNSTGGIRVLDILANGEIGIGTNGSINTSAKLEVSSTTKGFLPPRMTKTQRDAISSPATGLVIYQTDNTPGLRCYNGTNWMRYTETAD